MVVCHADLALAILEGAFGGTHNSSFDYFQAYGGARSGKPVATRLQVPETIRLGANYPNPFTPSTSIRYDVPVAGLVRLEIFNILGQQVRALVDGQHAVGSYQVVWDGTDDTGRAVRWGVHSPAVYIEARKMTLLR